MAAIASSETETSRSLSARRIVGNESPVAFAIADCERFARWRAARIWEEDTKGVDINISRGVLI